MELIKNQQWTQDNDVDLIRKLRDDLVKDFLDERYLKEFIFENYNVRELPNVKLEFLRKELKELLQSSLDVQHYEPILSFLRETGSDTLADGQDELFFNDIEKILKRYIFLKEKRRVINILQFLASLKCFFR
ncbi:MAG: hypothetical protein QM762_21715 [Chryseolinea sp.]